MSRARSPVVVALTTLLCGALLTATARGQVGRSQGVLDANLASVKELQAVPHLTPALAQAIVAGRPYATVTALDAVLAKSLKRDQIQAAYAKLFVPLNLNLATREEILLIPGVGERMLHEFQEYRPYPALAQFHREIDKYVDDAELARLEQYVFVPVKLNTASDQDILSIPGLGQRMLSEFKKYRPYKGMAQFRREIGKYVNKTELARLERYVTVE
jgi:DNA uptake protein ComE-like DNA-binding protein